jgi:predicted DNA-binding protein
MLKEFLVVRIDTDTKQRLQQRAEAEHRVMSQQVIHLIEKYLSESDVSPTSPTPQPTAE